MGRLLSAVLVALLVAASACADTSSSDSDTICDSARQERADPSSAVHILPNAPEPTYLSDPPTSGPHTPSPGAPSGDAPISRPVQVGLLHNGIVLVQFRDVDPAEVEQLRTLAGDQVVVAPNPDLPTPVVATGWLVSMRCDGVDLDALGGFIHEHGGHSEH